MTDINNIHPGKLKRKNKKNATPSVVDLPGINNQPTPGNLLGDVLFDTEDAVSSPSSSSSLVDLKPVPLAQEVSLKSDDDIDAPPSSPLDKLKSDSKPKPASDSSDASSNSTSTEMPESIAPHRLQKKNSKQKSVLPEAAPADNAKLQELLNQAHDINQKCIDTLNQLQNTNVQNEKRYALYLTIGFAILVILAIIGVVAGINLKNNAKTSDIKFKQEAYTNAINEKKVLEAEYEKDRKGSDAAFEVYHKIEQGLFEEAVEQFAAVRNELTHPAEIALLEEKIESIKWKLAENAYHDGVMLFNASNFEQARDAFFKSFSLQENTSYTPRLYYYLAMSLYQLTDFEGARRYFSRISPSELSPDMDALTRYYRGICAEKLGDENEAYEQFDSFLKKYKFHRLADDAVKHRAKVESGRNR